MFATIYKTPVIIIEEPIQNKTLVRGSENWRSRSQVIDREISWRSRMSTNKTLVSSSKVAIAKNDFYKTIAHCTKVLKLNKMLVTIYKTPVTIIDEAIEKSSWRSRAKRCGSLSRRLEKTSWRSSAKDLLDKILVHYIKYL